MGRLSSMVRRFVQGRETVGDAFVIEPVTQSGSAAPVTLSEARGLPGVGRGARLIADVASQLPMFAERHTDTPDITERVFPTPQVVADPGRDTMQPGPGWVWSVVDSLVWLGNALAVKDNPDGLGYPRSLPLVNMRDARYDYDLGRWEVLTVDGPVAFRPSEVLHMKVHAEAGERLGLGLLDTYQAELQVMRAAEHAQYVLLEHGVPTGLLKVDPNAAMTPDDATRIKDKWMASQAKRSVAVMSNVDFQAVSFNADEISMIPTREFNLRLASDITGVPPYMLGVPSESRVYANAETEWNNFIRITLQPYLAPVEYGLSTCLPSRGMADQRARFDLAALARADAMSRWTVYQMGINMGAITIEEIRNREGLGPADNLPTPTPAPLEVVREQVQ